MLSGEKRFDLASQIAGWVVLVALVITPLMVFPILDNMFFSSKLVLSSSVTLILIALFAIHSWLRNHLTITLSPFLLALSLFLATTLISIFFTGQYPVENLLGFGGMYLSFSLIAIVGGSLLIKSITKPLYPIASLSASLLALLSLLEVIGRIPSTVFSWLLPFEIGEVSTFTLTGSPVITLQILTILGVLLVTWILVHKKAPWWSLAGVGLIVVGLAVNIWPLLPGQPNRTLGLPFAANWSVAVDTMRTPRTALIGVGTDNFRSAYSQFRPSWINTTPVAGVRYLQGTNTPLTLWVTGGLLMLSAWIWMVVVVVRQSRHAKSDSMPIAAAVLASLLLQLIWPANAPVMILLGSLLAIWTTLTRNREARIHALAINIVDQLQTGSVLPKAHRASIGFVTVIILGLVGLATYGLGRAVLASSYSLKALVALQENKAIDAYNHQRRATELNPYLDINRSRYALTNIQIAIALGNKVDITEDEKQQVSQLIQQAIREARAATFINPGDYSNWLVLGQIYRQLIGVATDADQWTVSAYTQAILTNPTDPGLRLELGGVFMAQNQFAEAANLFQQVNQLKPDYANGYYNLANALVKLNQLESAQTAYKKSLSLVPADSENYTLVTTELAAVEKALAEAASKESSNQPLPVGNNPQTASGSALTKDLSILNENVTSAPQDTVTPDSNPVQVNQKPDPAVTNSDLNR